MAKQAKKHPAKKSSSQSRLMAKKAPSQVRRPAKKSTSVVTRGTSRAKPADPTTRTASTSRKKAADSTARTSTRKRKSTEPAVQRAGKRQKTRPLTTDDIPTIVRAVKDAFPETSRNPEDTQATEDTVSDVSDQFGMYSLLLLSACMCV